MAAVRERLSELTSTTDVVLVTFTDPARIDSYQETNHIPFPILIDIDRSAYEAFGLERGSFWRVWGWKALRRYLEIFRTGGLRGLRLPVEDTRQLGGDFVIAADGTIALAFYGEGPDDRPSVNLLVDALA